MSVIGKKHIITYREDKNSNSLRKIIGYLEKVDTERIILRIEIPRDKIVEVSPVYKKTTV